MRRIVLFIAMSLDGYIADKDGNVDWLQGQAADKDDMQSYSVFIKEIDTVVMGFNTYYQIVTELSPNEWFYKDLISYVVTHSEQEDTDNIKFVNKNICNLVNHLKQESGRDIWICGGASIIQPLIQSNLIDKFHISIIPTILGNGIRLFESAESQIKLKLIRTENYNGITDLIYERR